MIEAHFWLTFLELEYYIIDTAIKGSRPSRATHSHNFSTFDSNKVIEVAYIPLISYFKPRNKVAMYLPCNYQFDS